MENADYSSERIIDHASKKVRILRVSRIPWVGI